MPEEGGREGHLLRRTTNFCTSSSQNPGLLRSAILKDWPSSSMDETPLPSSPSLWGSYCEVHAWEVEGKENGSF